MRKPLLCVPREVVEDYRTNYRIARGQLIGHSDQVERCLGIHWTTALKMEVLSISNYRVADMSFDINVSTQRLGAVTARAELKRHAYLLALAVARDVRRAFPKYKVRYAGKNIFGLHKIEVTVKG